MREIDLKFELIMVMLGFVMEYKLLLVTAVHLQNCKDFLSAAVFCRRCVLVSYVKKIQKKNWVLLPKVIFNRRLISPLQ